MMTRPDAQAMALSITKANLRDNLWKELAGRYERSEILRAGFEFHAERIVSREHPQTWWISARAFAGDADKEAQAQALAGFHGSHVMVALDECGDIPLGVLAAADAIHATVGTEARTVAAGNPTNPRLALGEIVHRQRSRWCVVFISGDPDDPKRSPRIDLEWSTQLIAELGRDHPWVRVNVLGLFPLRGTDSLIGDDDVTKAMQRVVTPKDVAGDANIFGLDPARFGDDEQVLVRRKGLAAFRSWTWRSLDGHDLAVQVIRVLEQAADSGDPCDVLFVDVGGVGASVFDHLRTLGWGHLISAVDFGGRAMNADRYYNHRSEMWGLMADWIIKRPSGLPNDAVLATELAAPKYAYRVVQRRTCMILESKDDMKSRGVPSPNRADALALTFAGPAFQKSRSVAAGRAAMARTAYDPLAVPVASMNYER
jgi:hypothetical protein